MTEFIDKFAPMISEKPLEGDYVLRMVRIGDKNPSFRLCLSEKGLSTVVVFAGDVARLINREEFQRYFDLIQSSDEFYRLSEQLRTSILDTLIKG